MLEMEYMLGLKKGKIRDYVESDREILTQRLILMFHELFTGGVTSQCLPWEEETACLLVEASNPLLNQQEYDITYLFLRTEKDINRDQIPPESSSV